MPTTKERRQRTAHIHIYVVTINGEPKLVRASSRARAIKAIVSPVEARIASQDDLVDLLGQGIGVENAGAAE